MCSTLPNLSVPRSKSWHRLLNERDEYLHGIGLLKQAEAVFYSRLSNWLMRQNSFNQVVFLALQRHLAATGHLAACKTVGKDGRFVDFGVTCYVAWPMTGT